MSLRIASSVSLICFLVLAGCSKQQTPDEERLYDTLNGYRITSVKVLTGSNSEVSDADTYIVKAAGKYSTIEARGFYSVRIGDKLCNPFGDLLYPAWNPGEPCQPRQADNVPATQANLDNIHIDIDSTQFKIVGEERSGQEH